LEIGPSLHSQKKEHKMVEKGKSYSMDVFGISSIKRHRSNAVEVDD